MPEHPASARTGTLANHVNGLVERGHRAVVAATVGADEHHLVGASRAGPPPTASTLFEIGSVTKVLTGVLLADAVVRGEVALSDPLFTHLPAPHPAWRFREPTLLELATHRSALANTPGPLHRSELVYAAGLRRESPWSRIEPGQFADLVASESPRHPPGSRARYSSVGVALLGDALAAQAGTTYLELLDDRVLAPLGMGDTFITVPAGCAERLLGGHSRWGRPRPPLDDLMPAAGSLRSSAADLLTFLGACLLPPPGVLGEALRLAQQPQARMGGGIDVGLCWMSFMTRDRGRVVWHNGGTWGFRSFVGLTPDRGGAAVVLSNTEASRLRCRLLVNQDGDHAQEVPRRST